MISDSLGHLYPYIIEEKCIDCFLCSDSCPSNHAPLLQKPKSVWAAWSNDDEDRLSSSSGGVASVLSSYVVNKGGVVYGVVFEKPFTLIHRRISNRNDLKLLKGSKYAQADTRNTFKNVLKDLKNNFLVMYIGTPCQIAGVKAYLKKDYENLITVDLICHGVPSLHLLKESIPKRYLEKEFDIIKFRNSTGYHFSLRNNNLLVYDRILSDDYFLKGFFTSLFFRDSCYTCPYATTARVADITLGDFWGLKDPIIDVSMNKGISLVLINSQKGAILFDENKHFLSLYQRTIEEAVSGNKQLGSPSKRTLRSKLFRKIYPFMQFNTAVCICLWEIFLKSKLNSFLNKS